MRTFVVLFAISLALLALGSYRHDEMRIENGLLTISRYRSWGCAKEVMVVPCTSMVNVRSTLVTAASGRQRRSIYEVSAYADDGVRVPLPVSICRERASRIRDLEQEIRNGIRSGGGFTKKGYPGIVLVQASLLVFVVGFLFWQDAYRRSRRGRAGVRPGRGQT